MSWGKPGSKRDLRPADFAAARRIQDRLRTRVRLDGLRSPVRLVAGADAAFLEDLAVGAACLLTFPALEPVSDKQAVVEAPLPYRPGYLSFREGYVLAEAILALPERPDLVLIDGQGIAHPKRLGLASFLGVILGLPTVGCAKSRLIGEHEDPPPQRGAWTVMRDKGEAVGAALRTRAGVRPVFVSPGHLTDLEQAVEFVLACGGGFRIPEPLRRADRLSKAFKRDIQAAGRGRSSASRRSRCPVS
jgi:deoxyribonuclease V